MYIDKICVCGFKNYKESIIYDFSNFSTIEGRNSQGKTSIAEAITWGLYGCDLNGDCKADSKLKNKESEDMYVIIDFYYNGQSNRILRKKSKSLTLKLNDEKISEKELLKFLPNRDLFLAIFNPKYFLNYNVSKQRELLLKMLPQINSEDIIEKFNLSSISHILAKYPSVNDGIKSYNSLIKSKNELIKEKYTSISIYQDMILENSKPIDTVEEFTIEDEKALNELHLRLNSSNKVEEISTDTFSFKISELRNAINLESSKSFKSMNDSYIKDLELSLATLSGSYSSLKEMHSKLLNCESSCPTCGQNISEEHKQTELNSLESRISNITSEINALNDIIKSLKAMDEKNRNAFNLEKERKIDELNTQIISLQQTILDINQTNKLLREGANNIPEEISNKIEQLKNKQLSYMEYKTKVNAQKKAIQSNKDKIATLNQQILELKKHIQTLEIELHELKEYNSAYVQYVSEILSTWLKDVSIDLFTIVGTTGEVKDTFEVKYCGKDLRLISKSEYTKTGLEISDMFNKALNISLPIFVDDGESILDIPRCETQMLVAKVKNCDLTIINNCNEPVIEVSEQQKTIIDYSEAEQLSF